VPVLAVLSGALWLAVAITMSAFADGAGNVDEGVNVQALYLTLPALTLPDRLSSRRGLAVRSVRRLVLLLETCHDESRDGERERKCPWVGRSETSARRAVKAAYGTSSAKIRDHLALVSRAG
jgi:hypothetical protein